MGGAEEARPSKLMGSRNARHALSVELTADGSIYSDFVGYGMESCSALLHLVQTDSGNIVASQWPLERWTAHMAVSALWNLAVLCCIFSYLFRGLRTCFLFLCCLQSSRWCSRRLSLCQSSKRGYDPIMRGNACDSCIPLHAFRLQ